MSRKRTFQSFNVWPGYVDALSALLMVVIFVLLTFVLAQFALSYLLNDKDIKMSSLQSALFKTEEKLDTAEQDIENKQKAIDGFLSQISQLQNEILHIKETLKLQNEKSEDYKKTILEKESLVTSLTGRIESTEHALKTALSDKEELRTHLNQSFSREKSLSEKITNLEEELKIFAPYKDFGVYRSIFFEKLIKVLGNRNDVRVVGDRFIFQSEVLFAQGSDVIGKQGKQKLDDLVKVLKDIRQKIKDTPWILRVDGHSDAKPIKNSRFPSNWELSSARAIAVVRYLMSKGIEEKHLVAAGFGSNRPIDNDKISAKNRRIEFKLDRD